jgi:hypothetical protein
LRADTDAALAGRVSVRRGIIEANDCVKVR